MKLFLLCIIVISFVRSLKILSTSMNIMHSVCGKNKYALLHLFRSLMVGKSAQNFSQLMSVPTLPLGRILMDSAEAKDLHRLSRLLTETNIGETDNNELAAEVYWSWLHHQRNVRPAFHSILGSSERIWNMEQEMLEDCCNLSTRKFCKHILPSSVMGSLMWTLIDTECLLSSANNAIPLLIKNLFSNHEGEEERDLNGLGPVLRLQQVLVNHEYILTLEPTAKGTLIGRTSFLINDLFGPAHFPYPVPEDTPIEIYYCIKETVTMIRNRIKRPYAKASYEYFEGYLEGTWKMIWNLSNDGATRFIRSRALINVLILEATYKTEPLSEGFEEKLGKVLSDNPKHVPCRDLYSLLVILLHHRRGSIRQGVLDMIIRYIYIYELDPAMILKVNESHFGLLHELVEPCHAKSALRFWLWLAPSPKYQSSIDIFDHDYLREEISKTLEQHYMPVHEAGLDYPMYLPKLEIHPYIDSKLLQLLKFAVMMRMNIPIRFHPAYFSFLIDRGMYPRANEGTNLKQLVKLVIKHQFIMTKNEGENPFVESLQKFDTLHSVFTEGRMINGKFEDYQKFVRRYRKDKGYLARIWIMESKFSCIYEIIEKMAVDVWSSKVLPMQTILPVGRADLLCDSQQLLLR